MTNLREFYNKGKRAIIPLGILALAACSGDADAKPTETLDKNTTKSTSGVQVTAAPLAPTTQLTETAVLETNATPTDEPFPSYEIDLIISGAKLYENIDGQFTPFKNAFGQVSPLSFIDDPCYNWPACSTEEVYANGGISDSTNELFNYTCEVEQCDSPEDAHGPFFYTIKEESIDTLIDDVGGYHRNVLAIRHNNIEEVLSLQDLDAEWLAAIITTANSLADYSTVLEQIQKAEIVYFSPNSYCWRVTAQPRVSFELGQETSPGYAVDHETYETIIESITGEAKAF